MFKMCEIEAAGPEGIILSFNNEFICGRIINEESGSIPKDAAEIPSDQTKEHEDDIVQEAEDIFGKDLIEIKED